MRLASGGVRDAFHRGRALFVASLGSGVTLWAIDVATWPSVRRPWPLVVSLALAIANGASLGLAVLAGWIPTRLLRLPTAWRWAVGLLLTSVLVGIGARQAFGVLTVAAWKGLMAPCAAVVIVTLAWGWSLAVDTNEASPRRTTFASAALAGVAAVVLVLDRTVLSAVVERHFSFIEGVGVLALALSCYLALTRKAGGGRGRRLATIASVGALAWSAAFLCSTRLRLALESALPAVWEEPVYAARWLRRARQLERRQAMPNALERVALRYDLRSRAAVDEAWNTPVETETRGLAGLLPVRDWNLAVFFVDTLRADVARDPQVMPETVRWMERAFSFDRAYSTGSSTVLALNPMLGCRYDARAEDAPKLLDSAKRSGMRSAMVIPRSAHDYHRRDFPGLRFDDEEVVADVESSRQAVAGAVVDRSLAWLREQRPDRFLLWLYQFDVHGWPDLDERYVDASAESHGFSKTEGLHWRYRAAARGVDEAFGRFLAGLEAQGLADRTLVVFVADHGEALGQNNYWAHSTYLWESLVRVPLAIAVPGSSGGRVGVPVSTIDLGTTLIPLAGGDRAGCHGHDLFAETPRRHPILFSAMIDGRLTRVGILGDRDRKVVVDLRDADARLLRIGDDPSFESDVSNDEPHALLTLLEPLIRAPIVPGDFR